MPSPGRDGEKVTYRRYLVEQTYLAAALDNISVDPFSMLEAVSSVAIEHPEWPMNEERTRAEWKQWEKTR